MYSDNKVIDKQQDRLVFDRKEIKRRTSDAYKANMSVKVKENEVILL